VKLSLFSSTQASGADKLFTARLATTPSFVTGV
jgi:hypothetical protein